MIDQIASLSEKEGLNTSRLPEFTDDEIEYIKGTHDYIGINQLFTFITWDTNNETHPPSAQWDMRINTTTNASWDQSNYYVVCERLLFYNIIVFY